MSTGFRQLGSLFALSTRTLHARKSTSMVAIIGFSVTSAVLVAVLALSNGLAGLWKTSGPDNIAIVMARNAFAEVGSRLPGSSIDQLRQTPGVDRGSSGSISAQLLLTATLPRASDGKGISALVRGYLGEVPRFDSTWSLDAGRIFSPGRNEVVVGRKLASSLGGLHPGSELPLGGTPFTVVGVVADHGSLHESEIWGDANQIGAAMGENGQVSSIYVKLASPDSFTEFASYVDGSRTLEADAVRQSDYLRRQADRYRQVVLVPGIAIVVLMAIAAMLAAFNTMQSAVHGRMRELATLRAIGFGAPVISLQIVLEAALLGCAGAALGTCIAGAILHDASVTTSNGLSAVALTMSVTPLSMAEAVVLMLAAAVLSGTWPAIVLSRACIADALRKT